MRNNVIFVVHESDARYMEFWYKKPEATYYLFTTGFRKCAYHFFRSGKSLMEICHKRSWKKNTYLRNLIEKHVLEQVNLIV